MPGILTQRYVAEPASLSAQPLRFATTGLVIGRGQHGQAVTIEAFRPEPTRIGLVSDWSLGRLMLFRALALGVRVVLRTTSPGYWQGLAEWATDRSDRLYLMTDGNEIPPVLADANQPALHLIDVGADGASVSTPELPWHTRLTMVPQLNRASARALADADVHLFRRLTADEVSVAVGALRLPVQHAEPLGMLNPDMLGALTADRADYVWLSATSVERQYLGLTE
jgi:hypothetical protein